MKTMLRSHAFRRAIWAVPLLAGLLASCGGGGGVPPPTLNGEVHGLAPALAPNSGVLVLSVNGTRQTITTPGYVPAVLPVTFAGPFTVGQAYSVAVQTHPAGQICAVTQAGSGRLDASVSNLRVECHTTRLNDTGIAGATPAEVSARAPDSQSGRDAEQARLTKVGGGAYGFDFSKICSSGDLVDATGGCPSGATWDCVRDNVTGLMWRRADQAYAGTTPTASERVCERVDWRAPTVHELLSIVHAGRAAAPYIDTDFFDVDVASARLYSVEIYRDAPANERWTVDFSNAGIAGKYSAGGVEQRRALWVAGTSALDDPGSAAYGRTNVGTSYTLIDTRRELMWLVPKAVAPADWSAAVDSVAGVNATAPGSYSDWRLPNRSELDTLVNRAFANPAMDPAVQLAIPGPGLAPMVYWSASPFVGDLSRSWVIDFTYGDVSTMLKNSQARLIYVRNRVFNPAPLPPI